MRTVMSDDLISRSKLIKILRSRGNPWGNYVETTIRKMPVAYDVRNVAKSISEIGQRYCNSVKCDKNCDNCEHGCLMMAITNAVKSGGVADEK